MPKQMTYDEFVKRSNEKHGFFYDYSKVEYKNSQTKVCIICPIHGEFMQRPNKHLNGQGCPKCGDINRIKTKSLGFDKFEERSSIVHNGKYEYHQDYVNYYTRVRITCPIHGDFYQMPCHHLYGQGCPKCGFESTHESQRLSVEDFIQKAKEIHGDKYEYENSNAQNVAIKPQLQRMKYVIS